jgi:hypothetical protein
MRDRRRGFVLGLLLLTVASGAVPAAGERAELGAAFERLAAEPYRSGDWKGSGRGAVGGRTEVRTLASLIRHLDPPRSAILAGHNGRNCNRFSHVLSPTYSSIPEMSNTKVTEAERA